MSQIADKDVAEKPAFVGRQIVAIRVGGFDDLFDRVAQLLAAPVALQAFDDPRNRPGKESALLLGTRRRLGFVFGDLGQAAIGLLVHAARASAAAAR